MRKTQQVNQIFAFHINIGTEEKALFYGSLTTSPSKYRDATEFKVLSHDIIQVLCGNELTFPEKF